MGKIFQSTATLHRHRAVNSLSPQDFIATCPHFNSPYIYYEPFILKTTASRTGYATSVWNTLGTNRSGHAVHDFPGETSGRISSCYGEHSYQDNAANPSWSFSREIVNRMTAPVCAKCVADGGSVSCSTGGCFKNKKLVVAVGTVEVWTCTYKVLRG